jgi:hypothetical protein
MPLNSPRGNPANLPAIRKKFLQLHPVNAASGGQYSFRNGLPLIKFDISSSDAPLFMEGNELRLNGNITFRTQAGAQLTATDTNFVDGFTGSIAAVIDTVHISSKRLNSSLERCNLYSRMVPSIMSGVHSEQDIDTSMCHGGLHNSTIPLTRPMITGLNIYNTQQAVTAGNQVGKAFSTPIYLGLVNSGEDLDLSANTGIGGATIEILLKSDVNTCFGVSAAANNVTYTLDNLLLTLPVYEFMGEPAQEYGGQLNQFDFNTWSAIFQTVNTSDSVIAFTPGLSRIASCFMNFITATDLGNQLFNYSRLGPVAELRQVRYSKNGVLFPLQFRLETVEEENDNRTQVAGNAFSNHTVKPRAVPLRNYLESVRTDRYNKVSRTSLQWNGWSNGVLDRNQNCNRDGIRPGSADCLGILYDAYGSGTDFSQMVFSTELQFSATSLGQPMALPVVVAPNRNQENGLNGTANTSQATCLYFLNKNTLLFSPTGIDVQR